MFSMSSIEYIAVSLLSASQAVLGRERWLERDDRAVYLHPRRFGQEQPVVLQKISAACPGQVCGNLAGQAVTPLLASQPECSQQDLADAIIDASKQFDSATQTKMIALAIEYRQVEKNTPPDFTTDPPSLRNSVFCQKAPKNAELGGLVQAQDPANDPNLFFDPATKATVQKGAQENTSPFRDIAAPLPANKTISNTGAPTILAVEAPTTPCVSAITLTVSGTNPAATGSNAITINVGNFPPSTLSTPPATTTVAPGVGNIGNFGKCSIPQIEFGVGFDGRMETSFQPVDKTSFNHGSAQNIAIISQFICDTLTNTCGADQTAKITCASAQTAALGAASGTGAQSDAFNAVFGILTDFAGVPSVDNQGNIIPGTGNVSGAATTTTVNLAQASQTANAAPAATNTAIGNFGKCSVPEIEFGAGFDGRKETSFQPVDKASYSQGSAQSITTITEFICNALSNSCGADQTAEATCVNAATAASVAPSDTGAQADAFNAAFGITTNFANVAAIDDQGNLVGGGTTSSATSADATRVATSTAAAQTNAAAVSTSGNLQAFTAALGGVKAPDVTKLASGKFEVAGNSEFQTEQDALARSCDIQNNQCADAANASGNKAGFTVAACNTQHRQCTATANAA